MPEIDVVLVILALVNVKSVIPGDTKAQRRVISGTHARLGQFPWTAFLLCYIKPKAEWTEHDYSGRCSGSLIDDEFVMTAAHCVDQMKECEVTLGAVDLQNLQPNNTIHMTDLTKFYPHPCYTSDPKDTRYDIALMKLPRKVSATPMWTVEPILFALATDNKREEPYKNIKVFAIGWGYGKPSDRSTINTLRYAKMDVLKRQLCIKNDKLFKDVEIVCAIGDNQQICEGDSGGPLIIYDTKGVPRLIAISVFILKNLFQKPCTDSTLPQGFLAISPYSPWFNEIIQHNRFLKPDQCGLRISTRNSHIDIEAKIKNSATSRALERLTKAAILLPTISAMLYM